MRNLQGRSLLFVVVLASAFLSACGGHSEPTDNGDTGRAVLRLSATSASGKVYRLRSAIIDVRGPRTTEIAGPLDPADPQATTTVSLPPGAYQFGLRGDWKMYQVPPAGDPVEVPALLTGANPVAVEI